MKSMSSHTNNQNIIAVLGALALFLSLIEYVIPKPIPFIKIGIANLPVILSLILLTPKETLILIFIKSIGSGLVSGTIFSWIFIYSLSGSLSSGIIMLFIYKTFKSNISMIGVSICGALASNSIQILIAIKLLGGGAKYIGIPILITGMISGFLLGLFANNFIKKSQWIRSKQLKS